MTDLTPSTWDDVLARVERALSEELAQVGELLIATEMGVFLGGPDSGRRP